ncbi:MAG: accessory factor UbiK family protein [Betaproteobacteria bacterium]|nr:accessory factor UbiK family protein [Betaproteobacteria bacterium]
MAEPRILDELGVRISEVLKNSPAQDLEKNLRALAVAFFDRFEVVTREDFEVQKRVLERARSQLAELESRLAELERRPNNQPG